MRLLACEWNEIVNLVLGIWCSVIRKSYVQEP